MDLRRLRPILSAAAIAAALVACSTLGKNSTSSQAHQITSNAHQDAVKAPGGGSGAASKAAGGISGSSLPGLPSRIQKNGEVSLEAARGRFDDAWNKIVQAAGHFHGYVATSNRGASQSKDSPPFGSLTIRVPVDQFENALVAIRGIAKVKSDSSTSQDVTQEYVDLESRLRNLRAQEAVLLKLMSKASSINETLTVQQPLSSAQDQIEQIIGRQNLIRSQTDSSTVVVNIAEPGAASFAAKGRLAKAMTTAVRGLEGMGIVTMVALIWGIPISIIATLGMHVARRLRRRPSLLEAP